MKPVFFINTSSDIDFNNLFNRYSQLPAFIYSQNEFSIETFNKIIKELYGLNSRYSNLSTSVSIVIIDDDTFSSKNITSILEILIKQNPGKISELFFFQILKDKSTEAFDNFLKNRNKRRTLFIQETIPVFDFFFSLEIYNSEETMLEFKNLRDGFSNFLYSICLNYNDIIRSLDVDDNKLYSYGNANINVPHKLLKKIAISQLELLMYFDFINPQFANEKIFNSFKEKIINELPQQNISDELISDYEVKDRNLIHGTKIHPLAYEYLNKILPASEISSIMPTVSSNYLQSLYNRRNQEINSLFYRISYSKANEENLQNDLSEQFNSFQNTIDRLFNEFKNKDLLSLEDSFIGRVNERINRFTNDVGNLISDILSQKKEEIRNRFGISTSIEVCIGLIEYIIEGKSDYVVKAETETFDLPHIERIISDFISSGNSEIERHNKRISEKNNLDNDLDQIVKAIDSNNEEVYNNYCNAKDLESELILGIKKRNKNVRSIFNLTRLTNALIFTFLPILILFIVGILFKNSNIKYYLFSLCVPIVLGALFYIKLLWEYKSARKKYKEAIDIRRSLFIRYLRAYDMYISNTLEIIKNGYIYKLLNSLLNHLRLKVYELIQFRKHLIYQFSISLSLVETEIDFSENAFSISPVSVENYFNHIISEVFSSAGNNLKPFLHIVFNDFITKNKLSASDSFELQKFQVGIFEEIDPDEVVAPLPEHKDQYYKTLGENKEEVVLFLKGQKEQLKIEIDDIKQGDIGNCYFMSAIGAIAKCNPDYIKNMIFENDNTFTIKFYNQDELESYVTIDDKFWQDSENDPLYAKIGNHEGSKKEIWPMILEKAWAKINNGYSNIVGSLNNNIKIDYGLALTGRFMNFKMINENTDLNELELILKNHFSDERLPVTLSSLDKESQRLGEDPTLIKNHAYALKSFDQANKTVTIFNPHGSDHFIDVPIDFISKNFDCIYLFEFKDPKWKFNIRRNDKIEISPKIQIRCNENEYVYSSTEKFIENISFKTLNLSEDQLKEFAFKLANLSFPWVSKNLINKLNFDNKIHSPELYVFISEETNLNDFDDTLLHNIRGNIQNNRIETNFDFEIFSLMTIPLVTNE